ncbi:MAG TPA: type VI secretion system protein TssA [Bryobacteraceae bacterium]|jgi:type VI secretion system protein ImpA|nr:type VI secretion system protein TssA [Bryobacteraceae bacterium]
MADIEPFLVPIPGENPCGQNLYYAPIYDQIKEARRMEDTGPMGAWVHEAKTADFKLVIKLSEGALLKNSKDLQIAAWLLEAWINRDHLPGLISGLQLLKRLLETFWDNIYPEREDDDLEMRAKPLEWVGSYFDPGKSSSPIFQLRSIPISVSGHSWFVYQESRRIGYETEIQKNEQKKKAREVAIKDGKVTPEGFDKDFAATPKATYKKLEAEGKHVLEVLSDLDAVCTEKFQTFAPSFLPLRKGVEEFANVVHILLLKKLEKEPDPVEAIPTEQAAPVEEVDGQPAQAGAAAAAAQTLDLSSLAGGEISSGDQAVLHVLAAAQYLRRNAPNSPVPYLLLRALRWGEVRANGALDNLPAPASDVRIQLKNSAAGNDWKRVLDTAESAMSTPCGRGWLDLQRYTVRAFDELGYKEAAKAVRVELKAFLTEFPQLANAMLSDDTGTANPETLAWLKKETLIA